LFLKNARANSVEKNKEFALEKAAYAALRGREEPS
jgi:hypothetical protein